jgi:hypothetical protein
MYFLHTLIIAETLRALSNRCTISLGSTIKYIGSPSFRLKREKKCNGSYGRDSSRPLAHHAVQSSGRDESRPYAYAFRPKG